jgi:hypothetical protein
MTQYYQPDITGQNPDYHLSNFPTFIFKNGQKLYFPPSPIFTSSLRIVTTDGLSTPLVQDVDWKVNPDDIDELAMSRAFLENPNFTDTLVKSVTVISTTKALKVKVAMSFQMFYATTPHGFDDGSPLELTPDVMKGLISGLADARQQLAQVSSPLAPNDAPPALLPFDINGTLAGNVITGEVIPVNTVAGGKVLRLTQGAFFADGLVLSYNGNPLNCNTDYLPIILSPLTSQTVKTGGIYQYILLTGAVTGDVSVTYHAVGGDVQRSDVDAAMKLMLAIKSFLSDNVFITSSTVSETPAFRALNARLTYQENTVRSLLTGAPTYGDSTAGASVIRPIAATDSNCHWWTIAKLYEVQGSSDIITADQFKGRVYLPGAKIALGFTVDVNLNQTRQPVSVKTDSLVFDPGYTLFGDVSVSAPVIPMLRVVWSQASQAFSGACLQIGLPLTALSDRMVVEDMSTTESCWLLDKTGQFITGNSTVNPTAPQDNNFVLPDGSTMWSSGGASSKVLTFAPQFQKGYLVYSGSNVTLGQLATQSSTASLFNTVLPSYFPIDTVGTVVVTLQSYSDSTVVYDVEVPLPLLMSGARSGRTTFTDASNELIALSAKLGRDGNNNVTLSLNAVDLTPLSTNSMTDVVRYIRVRV